MIEGKFINKQYIPLVNKFYRACRSRATAKKQDRVWVVFKSGQIIAALRIVEVCGYDLLTGVQVTADQQGLGIASQMLDQVFRTLYDDGYHRCCYAFPYVHLVDFYQKQGWTSIQIDDLPEPLVRRFLRYVKQRRKIAIMIREP